LDFWAIMSKSEQDEAVGMAIIGKN
ncbi:hypothetical protein LCGC14_1181670, partial [marine sediment metagenome]